jgi:type VI secretion system protein ImpE
MNPMTPEQLFRDGRLEEALQELQALIRKSPSDPKLRIFLLQLMMINGAWDRAYNQLKVVGELSADAHLMAAIFRPLIELEAFRQQVFAGQRSPLVFGEPEPFIGKLVQALSCEPAAAAELRASAFEEAPARSGRINGRPFEWLMDADPRMGPVLEVAMERKYYWMGLHHLKSVTAPAPSDLRDLIWLPAEFELLNGGRVSGFLYVRYPGSETAEDTGIRLARTTQWETQPGGADLGLGQRLFATDTDDFPLLELRQLEFDADDGSAGE